NATFEEGCLSVPEIFARVERSEKVRVRYYNEKGELKEEDLEGFNARVFLHEYDHLQGLLFIHRLSPVERIKVNSGLKELKRRYKNEN
ncbi:peptide deformylase, partial [bacterium]|nr:peptide deformylase [bacterium]